MLVQLDSSTLCRHPQHFCWCSCAQCCCCCVCFKRPKQVRLLTTRGTDARRPWPCAAASPAMRSEHPELAGPPKRCLGALDTVSWPWIPVLGSLEPPRRDGENAQTTGKNGGKIGEIRSKRCEGGGWRAGDPNDIPGSFHTWCWTQPQTAGECPPGQRGPFNKFALVSSAERFVWIGIAFRGQDPGPLGTAV